VQHIDIAGGGEADIQPSIGMIGSMMAECRVVGISAIGVCCIAHAVARKLKASTATTQTAGSKEPGRLAMEDDVLRLFQQHPQRSPGGVGESARSLAKIIRVCSVRRQ
jgi:hypothetical protein